MANRADSTAKQIRRRVLGSRDRFWEPFEFEGSQSSVAHELSRLAKVGELRHVRRGLYWRGNQTRLGMSVPSPEQLVNQLAGASGVGPAEWSAALALGLSTQHPRKDIIAVPSRPPRSLRHVQMKDRSARVGRRRWNLNRWEVALLEVLSDWQGLIEMPQDQAINRLTELVRSQNIRPDRLARAADTEAAVVRENVRRLLFVAGFRDEAARVRVARSRRPMERALPLEAAVASA
jgi:hypothetical protein